MVQGLWCCRVCGISPLCVVLGVFHCGYYGVVGFVVCPHSVLSLGCSTVDIVVQGLWYVPTLCCPWGVPLWILWCRVCGISPLCVVLGVFHCGYYGVVGFVVCPHSVFSLGCSTVDIVVLQGLWYVPTLCCPWGVPLWILWCCRVCGMTPLCVVLGVFHCGYYGVVGFVVCPHSVLSLGCCTVDITVLQGLWYVPTLCCPWGVPLWILWCCRVCGMSQLCVVLGVFHCGYCGVVGFVVCPHSVLSLGCCTVDIVVLQGLWYVPTLCCPSGVPLWILWCCRVCGMSPLCVVGRWWSISPTVYTRTVEG